METLSVNAKKFSRLDNQQPSALLLIANGEGSETIPKGSRDQEIPKRKDVFQLAFIKTRNAYDIVRPHAKV